MPSRTVTHVRRNAQGDITALSHPWESWSPREKEDAIADIGTRRCTYFIVTGKGRIPIQVVHSRKKGNYLRAVPTPGPHATLATLPEAGECPRSRGGRPGTC